MTRTETINRLLKPLLVVLLLAPLGLLVQGGIRDTLGANPVETILHQTGLWALRLLLLSLAITPLCRVTGIGDWVRFRRLIGLFSCCYALLHFSTYAVLDQGLDMGEILTDVLKRPYVTLGFVAFLLLLPLAATSHNGIIRRLGGQRWKRLHRLVYVAGLAGVLHYLWLVRADSLPPLLYLALFLGLMLFRLPARIQSGLAARLRKLSPFQRHHRLHEEKPS